MAGKINVLLDDGSFAFCKVVENLNYNHDAGAYCKIVLLNEQETLVKRFTGEKLWRPHTAKERVQPIIDYFARLERERKWREADKANSVSE